MNFTAYCFAPSRGCEKYSASASASAPQMSMTANSFRPIRRDRISSLPAAVSKNHCPLAFFFRGIGNGKIVCSYEQDLGAIHRVAPAVHDRIGRHESVDRGLVH